MICGLLLAAGRSSRMKGEDKLLKLLDGEPLLQKSATSIQQTQLEKVYVVVGPNADQHKSILEKLDIQIVEAREADLGLSQSIKAGVLALPPETSAVVIGLSDMPDVKTEHYDLVRKAFEKQSDKTIIQPLSKSGKPGHPVLFHKSHFGDLLRLTGDKGAGDLIKKSANQVLQIPMLDDANTFDLDTPEAWNAYLKSRTNH